MAVTKEVLSQYFNEKKEIEELRSKIDYLERRIPKLEKRIAEIEEGHTAKDKVRGGEGGLQSFVIEGVPYDEWNDKKAELEFKKRILEQRRELLRTSEMQLILRTKEVEKYISSINDSVVRRIMNLRVLNGLQWQEVANKIGGGNTDSSVKMMYQRFLEKNI